MKTFRIEMMSNKNYVEYLGGSNNYVGAEFLIEADNVQDAVNKAKNLHPEMVVINENFIKTIEEINQKEEERINRIKEEEAKRLEAKARKRAREIEQANKEGLTIEEYEAKKKIEKKIRATERKIAELKNELEKEEYYLKRLKERV